VKNFTLRVNRMFQKIVLHLEGPICSCPKQNLIWGIFPDETKRSGLFIQCLSCRTKVLISHKKFRADFDLKREYPEGVLEQLRTDISEDDEKFLRGLDMAPPED